MEFIDSYIEALRGEYLFLKEYYDVFRTKNKGKGKKQIDKGFHEEVLDLIETEQVGEDSYRLLVVTEKLEVKLPSVLDERAEIPLTIPVPALPKPPKRTGLSKPSLPEVPAVTGFDPCSGPTPRSYDASRC